ncbi:coiled-coil domain-containing protein [Cohnella fermenti]|uniref:hypothetical protein n=1 Tax=Cohnella fermenti TaxID=2565925 RepID=UPI001B3B2990|nr:hypothetical protein [Cohnella fermenti]
MPAISKIRFANVVYEGGGKRYNDETFRFDGHNAAILLENGGGKTVFIQTALQAVIPHTNLADRKLLQTLTLSGAHAHIAIEWILQDKPRQYAVTAVTLFLRNERLDSHKYVYTYTTNDEGAIEKIPFSVPDSRENLRPASAGEINDYYIGMSRKHLTAKTFSTIESYRAYLEKHFKIVETEWDSLATINSGEGDVEAFFENCKTTSDLVNRLLIPSVQKAIGGHGVGGFTDLFEGNRDNFRKNKQLKEQIEENIRIESELAGMMIGFERLDQLKQEENKYYEQMKAIYSYTSAQKVEADERYSTLQKQLESLIEEEKILEQEHASLAIADLTIKEEQANRYFLESRTAYETIKTEQLKVQHELEKLKYLRDKQDYDRKTAQLQAEELRLKSLDEEHDESELKEQLQVTLAQLKDVYEDKEHYLGREYEAVKRQIENTKQEKTKLDQDIESKHAQLIELDKQTVKFSVLTDELVKQKERIELEILENSQQLVESELVIWINKLEQVQKELVEQKALEQKAQKEKEENLELIGFLREDIRVTELSHQDAENVVKRVIQEQEQLLTDLRGLYALRNVSDVYLEQDKIVMSLEIEETKKKKTLESARLKERVASRLQDSYGDLDVFTADPWIRQWIRQIDYPVESGTDFAERLLRETQLNKQELFVRFPFWQMSIVVQPENKHIIEKKLEDSASELTFPVIVLSVYEARTLAEQPFIYQTVTPSYWPDVLETSGFELWKQKIADHAKAAADNVKHCEFELNGIIRMMDDLKRFLQRNSYKVYKERVEQKKQCEEKLRQLRGEIVQLDTSLAENEKVIVTIAEKRQWLSDFIRKLEYKMRKAAEWQNKVKELQTINIQLKACSEEMKIAQLMIDRMKKEQKSLVELLEELESNREAVYDLISELKGEELFLELKKIEKSMPAENSEAALKQTRILLKEMLLEVEKEKSAIERRIFQYQEEIKQQIIKLAEYKIELPDQEFPADGQIRIQQAASKLSGLTNLMEDKHISFKEAELKKREVEARLSEKIDAYHKGHKGPIHSFSDPLDMVETHLIEKGKRLLSQRSFLEKEEQITRTAMEELKKMLNHMDKQNIRYEFLSERVRQIVFPTERRNEFNLNKEQFVLEFLKQIEDIYKRVTLEKQGVERERQKFERFVEFKIKNEKLRQAALNGIRQRSTYQELREWERGMKERVARATLIAEQGMQEFNQDLKHFIQQLHTYMTTVRDELGNIEKMTRVKVEDAYKSIIVITTPTWEEDFARERLFRHVEWISERLTGDEYKTDEGIEDTTKVRRDIEKWLHPRHLLMKISEHPIKVQVRKVSNDNRVSHALEEWTTSNLWSGGEKWSKNMALFLGIQSYLSEKRQYVTKTKMNNRSAILDNPFGKASSDHVLEPVFFIANQLGYQIIALTAHTEGKFLRDYFPIIYSCRLRNAKDGGTSIIKYDQEIRHAYFEDKEPIVLERLGKVEKIQQLQMF